MNCMGASCPSLTGEVSDLKNLSEGFALAPMKVGVFPWFRLSVNNFVILMLLMITTTTIVVPLDQKKDGSLNHSDIFEDLGQRHQRHRWIIGKQRTSNIRITKPDLDTFMHDNVSVTKQGKHRFTSYAYGKYSNGNKSLILSSKINKNGEENHQQSYFDKFSSIPYFHDDILVLKLPTSERLNSRCKRGFILVSDANEMTRKEKRELMMRCGNRIFLEYLSPSFSVIDDSNIKTDHLNAIRKCKHLNDIPPGEIAMKHIHFVKCLSGREIEGDEQNTNQSYHLPQVEVANIECECVALSNKVEVKPSLPKFRQLGKSIDMNHHPRNVYLKKLDKNPHDNRINVKERTTNTSNATPVIFRNNNSYVVSTGSKPQEETAEEQNITRRKRSLFDVIPGVVKNKTSLVAGESSALDGTLEKRFIHSGELPFENIFSRKGKWNQITIKPSVAKERKRRNYGQRALQREKPLGGMSLALDAIDNSEETFRNGNSGNFNGYSTILATRDGRGYWLSVPLRKSATDRKRSLSKNASLVMKEVPSSEEKESDRNKKRENGRWTWKELPSSHVRPPRKRKASLGRNRELSSIFDKRKRQRISYAPEMATESLAKRKTKDPKRNSKRTHADIPDIGGISNESISQLLPQIQHVYRLQNARTKSADKTKERRKEMGSSFDESLPNKSLDRRVQSRESPGYSGASESSDGIDEALETNFLITKNGEEAQTFHGDHRGFARTLHSPTPRQKMMGRRRKRKIDISNVSVVEGEDAALPCDLKSADPNDSVQIILWIKEGLHTPLYSYDFRELLRGQPKETKPDANSTLSRRTSFQTDRSPAALVIQRTEMDDAGIYRCRVDFRHSPTINYRVNLTVVVAPMSVSITWYSNNSSPKTVVGSGVGPFLERSHPTIVCANSDGWPPPSVLWYENGKLLDESYLIDYEGVVVNALSLPSLTRDDLGRNFTCVASNTKRVKPAVKSIVLDMTLRIIGVKLIDLGTIWADEKSRAVCQIWGSKPPPNVLWWLGSLMLPPAETKVSNEDKNITLSYLDFIPKAEDDEAMLICQATNEMLPDQAVQDSTILTVNYAPLVSVHLGRSLDPEKIKEGDDVYFECTVISKPPVLNVIWKHNDVELVSGSGMILSNMSLVVQGVTRSHGGNYTCHATNVRNTSASPPLHLDVKYTPVCASEQRQQHSVGKQENAEISCKVDANPKVVSFRWTFNNTAEAIDVPEGRFVVVGTESRVNYTPMNELDYGTLLCWANNSIGVQQFPCVFQIVAAGKPDPPHNCKVSGVTISSLQVQCLAGDDGGLNQMFILHLYKIGSVSPIAELKETSPSFTINNLRPATSYKILIASLNEKGISRQTELTAYTVKVLETLEETSAEPARDRVRGTNIPLAAILGIIGAAVSVALASVFLVWFRVCRHLRSEDDGNEVSGGSGSEANANSHSSQSKEPATAEFTVSETSLLTTCHHDVQQLPDPSWSGEVALIATISGPSYVVAGGGSDKQYSTVTGVAAPPSQVQYVQYPSQGPLHTHLQHSAELQLQTPSRKVPHVPYFNESAQQVGESSTIVPPCLEYDSNAPQFSSSSQGQGDSEKGYHIPIQVGEKLYPYAKSQMNITGQDDVFPSLFHILPEAISKSSQNLSHCSIHHCQKDHVLALESSSVPPVNVDITRRGSLKRPSHQRHLSPQKLVACGHSNQSLEDLTKAHRKYPLTVDLLTASLNRTKHYKKERPLKVSDSQSCQQLIHTIPSSQRKNKMESAV